MLTESQLDALEVGAPTAHPNYPNMLVEKTSDGSLIYYTENFKIHNNNGAAVIYNSHEFYAYRFYLDGKDKTVLVRHLIQQGIIMYDEKTNTWDENAVVSITLAEG